MGLLSRRKNLLDEPTSELENLRHRKSQLTALLSAAEQRLAEATQDRQAKLLESDLANGPPIEVPVFRFADERDAVRAALATVDSKITDAQASVDREQDRIKRDAAAKKLNAAAEDLTKLASELSAVSGKIPNVLSAVLELLPVPPVSQPRVSAFVAGVLEALEVAAREAQSHVAQITAGAAQICEPAAQQLVTPPAPAIDRTPIFLLGPGRWLEPNGEVVTSGAHVVVSPPAPIAARALEFRHALDPLCNDAVLLRQRCPPRYGHYPPQDCLDISEPKPDKQPSAGSKTITEPLFHSAFAPGRAGVAVVERNPR
jgi:hypothetical protein